MDDPISKLEEQLQLTREERDRSRSELVKATGRAARLRSERNALRLEIENFKSKILSQCNGGSCHLSFETRAAKYQDKDETQEASNAEVTCVPFAGGLRVGLKANP